ncbi:hypothetical protein G6F31_018467 [Rhizopus arrhizus]|nr:hypothetical protein G6F31_018467 [Rhizopus arrhizus]
MVLDQDPTGGDRILGLGAVQADRLDVVGQAFFAQVQQGLGRAVLREELARGDVDRLVGRLRRQQYRNQQLERSVVFQFGGGVGVGRLQAGEDLTAFGCVHDCVGFRRARARASADSMAERLRSSLCASSAAA